MAIHAVSIENNELELEEKNLSVFMLILNEMRIMNKQLSIMTGESITEHDLEDIE